MDFKNDRSYSYNMDIHKSKIINCISNNLAKINTVHSDIIIILSSESKYSIIHDSYLETEPIVSDNAGGDFGNDAIIRLYDLSLTQVLFQLLQTQIIVVLIYQYINYSLLLMMNMTFVRDQADRDSQLKCDLAAA